MCLKVLALFLCLFVEWRVAEADCGRVGYGALCYPYPGVFFTDCLPAPPGNGLKGKIPMTVVDCRFNQLTSFNSNPEKFEAPDDVRYFVITELSIPEGVEVKIGRVTCRNGEECKVLTLTSDAKAPVVFRTMSNIFRIRATGEGVTLKFTCNSDDRQCKKNPSNNDRVAKRIVNGIVTAPHQFPFMARLAVYYAKHPHNPEECNSNGYVSDDDTQANCANGQTIEIKYCGGSIIHRNWILTGANCIQSVRGISGQQFKIVGARVVVGDHIRDQPDPERRIRWVPPSRIQSHTFNNPTLFNNDIAVLNLRPSIDLDDSFRYPICLPPFYMNDLDLTDVTAISAGWGMELDKQRSKELRKGKFEIITNAACQDVYTGYGVTITDKMMCTVNNQTHPCYGDGGGPTFCVAVDSYFYELGTLSFASTDTTTIWKLDEPNANTRVTKYVNWIANAILPDVLP